ncbi:MAG: M15 family metallopeptidase [Gammaproteobacteria bacterium]|nr:M15 family metallopeptidase [Gammaproteobacteria bacterium]MDD9894876.1 M15 family metallopeptidase [Gammaproteobacteria bacterium]MDD9957911.1 M15 family metallopeptidase [Gammaproteobacteria bacterium]
MARNDAGHFFTTTVTISEAYRERLRSLHDALGIPANYMDTCALPLCEEPAELVDTETDFYGRPQRLTREAFNAWTAMKSAAASDRIEIFLISAFRDIDYQHDVIKRKVEEGRSISEVLQANAAPGYSEHHTGRAVDIGTPGCDALVEAFENTPAFQWLKTNGNKHGFFMSYPRDNQLGILYEPWHWCFRKPDK